MINLFLIQCSGKCSSRGSFEIIKSKEGTAVNKIHKTSRLHERRIDGLMGCKIQEKTTDW